MLTAGKNEEPEGEGGKEEEEQKKMTCWAGQNFPILELQMAAGGVPQ